MPRWRTSRLNSERLHLDSGRPHSKGSWQASALTATTTLGGKAGRPASPGLLLESLQPLLEEALTPFADDLPWCVQACRDLVIAQSVGSIEHDPGPNDISIQRRIATRSSLELCALDRSETYNVGATSGHIGLGWQANGVCQSEANYTSLYLRNRVLVVGSGLSEAWILRDESRFENEAARATATYSRPRAWPNQGCSLVFIPGKGVHSTD